ncbi:UNVERIFIED_CONTAM: hypothetical protein HDU68_006270 [Siphonaria sp. JEL0065]|nr:hypothetical protein HDU68_006270 [Siphonaria sp. JEL0065]
MSPPLPPGKDYAHVYFQFDSLPLAIISTVICTAFFCILIYNTTKASSSFVRWTYFYFTGWGLLRVVGFTMRTVCLVGDNGMNFGLCITAMVFGSIGYIPLVKVLVQNVFSIAKTKYPSLPYIHLERVVSLFFWGLTGCVIAFLNLYLPNLPAEATASQVILRDFGYWGLALLAVLPTVFGLCHVIGQPIQIQQLSQVIIVLGLLMTLKMSLALYKNYHPKDAKEEVFFYTINFLPELVYMVFYLHPGIANEFAEVERGVVTVDKEGFSLADV